MKIIPEQVIPAKVEFTQVEYEKFIDYVSKRDRWMTAAVKANGCVFETGIADDNLTRFVIVPFLGGGGSVSYSLERFEAYCRQTGFVNGKQYQVSRKD